MSKMRRPRDISAHSLILWALLAAVPGLVFAQGGTGDMPENAHAKSYGSGWRCDKGYRAVDEACVAIKVPANAYLANTSYGRGWECGRGYREVDEACTAVKVPANAYLGSSGDSWRCDRGYREVNDACVAIKVPASAYLTNTSFGSGWECGRGYREVDEACVAIKVPKYAYLHFSGDRWNCDRGYQAKLTSIIPDMAGTVTSLTASDRIAALCFESIEIECSHLARSAWRRIKRAPASFCAF